MKKENHAVLIGLLVVSGVFAGCNSSASTDTADSAAEPRASANLEKFDRLDFDAFSKKADMKLFRELHCADVVVTYADGHSTTGIDQHVKDIENLFLATPDLRISSHPVKIGSGDWTGVEGVLEATFTQPMPIGGGQSIPPNGKTVKLPMATLARWKDGCIAEEHLFLDNAAYAKQLGLGG